MAKHNDTTSGNDASRPAIDWTAALEKHRPWLHTVVLARVGSPHAVDDVLQEVSVAAIKDGPQLRDPTKVAPWLYRVAVVTALQYRRKKGRERKLTNRVAIAQPPQEIDSNQPDPLDWLLAEEQRDTVRLALKAVSRRDAEILLLKYTQDWSYQQLAQHLGISISAVEARLHRARKKLRVALRTSDSESISNRIQSRKQ